MSNASRYLTGLLTAVLGLSLLAGCASSAQGGGGDIATVNGEKVSRSDFDGKLESSPQAKQVLVSMVQGMLIDQYAKDNKITISDADITKKEDEIKAKYPPGPFEQILKQQNLSEADVRNILRQQLIIEQAVGKNVNITDKQIADYLAKNHATLDKPQQIRAKHILVADKKTADMIEAQLKGLSGKALDDKFQELAKKYSTDPSSKDKGGELGFFQKGQMVPSFQDAAYAQKIGVVGPPVKSPFGYHIILVEERKPATVATMANSHDQIRDTLKQQQEQTQIPAFLQNLRSKATIVVSDERLKDAFPSPAPAASSSPAAPAATVAPTAKGTK
jgi:foldase protein PrsA